MTAEAAKQLDANWTTLIDTFDKYYSSIPSGIQKTISKAIADWQDFYYGTFDDWPETALKNWQTIFVKTGETLKAAIPAGAKAETQTTSPAANRRAQTQEVFTVSGKSSLPDYSSLTFGLPPWWAWALGAVPALAILYYTRRTTREF